MIFHRFRAIDAMIGDDAISGAAGLVGCREIPRAAPATQPIMSTQRLMPRRAHGDAARKIPRSSKAQKRREATLAPRGRLAQAAAQLGHEVASAIIDRQAAARNKSSSPAPSLRGIATSPRGAGRAGGCAAGRDDGATDAIGCRPSTALEQASRYYRRPKLLSSSCQCPAPMPRRLAPSVTPRAGLATIFSRRYTLLDDRKTHYRRIHAILSASLDEPGRAIRLNRGRH